MLKKSSIPDNFIVILLFVIGVILLIINRYGEDISIKINWGIGAGLIVGSITYFIDRLSKLFAKWEEPVWEGMLNLLYMTLLLVSGFLVLLFCSANPRYLALGTVLTTGSLTYFGIHIRKVDLRWIYIGIFVFIIGVILWALIDGLDHNSYPGYQIVILIILLVVLTCGIVYLLKSHKKQGKDR